MPEARLTRTRIVLALILACQAMIILDGTVVNVALPSVQRDLHMSAASLSWVLNAYTLAFGGLILLGGRAGDRLGQRRVFIAGVALFTGASLVGGLSPTSGALLAARAVQGVGAAIAAPSVLGLIATTFAEGEDRNRALGAFNAVSAAGASLGLLVGGILTASLSWRWVLFINVPVGLAILALAPRFVEETPRQRGELDVSGAIASTAGMVALVYGLIRIASDGWSDAPAFALFGAAVIALVSFVAIERRAALPVLPLGLFTDGTRAAAYLAMTLVPAAMLGMFFFLTQFLQDVLGYSPFQTGIAFLPMTALLFAISRTVPGRLPRFGVAPFLIGGTALLTLGTLWLTQISADSGYPYVLVAMLLLGLGGGSVFMPLSMLILEGVPARDSGAASGALQASQQVGGALGIGVLVTVFGTATQHVASPGTEALAHGMSRAFAASAAFCVAALAVSLFLGARARTIASARVTES
jgi:EmrB/QacA subfamily drug resistance transporter